MFSNDVSLLCLKAREGKHQAAAGIQSVCLEAVLAKGELNNKWNTPRFLLKLLRHFSNAAVNARSSSAAVYQMERSGRGCRRCRSWDDGWLSDRPAGLLRPAVM